MYYSKRFSAICEGVLIDPVTSEQFGGTDFVNQGKLAELDAVPLVDSVGDVPANPVQTGILISLAEDGMSAIRTKLWRSKTQAELDNEFSAAKDKARKNVNDVRTNLLETLVVEMDGYVFDADTVTRFNLLGIVFSMLNGISDPISGLWRTTDNQNVVLTLEQFKTLGGLMKTAAEQLYGISWQLKDVVIESWVSIDQANAFNAGAAFDAILNPPEPRP